MDTKEFYYSTGQDQKGPVNLEELKKLSITRNTLIWYKGITEWKRAAEVEELSEYFLLVSPAPPGLDQSRPQPKQTMQGVQKKRKTTRNVLLAIGGLVVLIAALIMINNPHAIPGMEVKINMPNPVVMTSRANDGNSSLFKEKTTVYATILNQGGNGNVLVTFHVYQDGNDYDRSKSIYLAANESMDMEVTFDEVRRLGGQITFNVETRAE